MKRLLSLVFGASLFAVFLSMPNHRQNPSHEAFGFFIDHRLAFIAIALFSVLGIVGMTAIERRRSK